MKISTINPIFVIFRTTLLRTLYFDLLCIQISSNEVVFASQSLGGVRSPVSNWVLLTQMRVMDTGLVLDMRPDKLCQHLLV